MVEYYLTGDGSFGDPVPERREWRFAIPTAFSLEMLENIAQGIEEGEITGGFQITIPIQYHLQIPKDLLDRLKGYIMFSGTVTLP